jgi:hypothetical protein
MRSLSLQIAAALVTALFALPITFTPIRWAKAFGWQIPGDLALTRYFARCLGALILTMVGLALWASTHPELQTVVLAATGGVMLMLSLIHVVGWLEKAQPPLETAEIFLYGAGSAWFLWLALHP